MSYESVAVRSGGNVTTSTCASDPETTLSIVSTAVLIAAELSSVTKPLDPDMKLSIICKAVKTAPFSCTTNVPAFVTACEGTVANETGCVSAKSAFACNSVNTDERVTCVAKSFPAMV